MTNPFNRADKHGAPDMRVTPPASAETPMAPPPAMNVGGTWYPLDAGEPMTLGEKWDRRSLTYAELQAINAELLAALELWQSTLEKEDVDGGVCTIYVPSKTVNAMSAALVKARGE